MKKIGITGENGFIGSNLVNYLEASNLYEGLFSGEKKYEIVKSKYRMEYIASLENFVMYSDIVIHLAGKNKGSDLEIINNNLINTKNLLDYCLRWEKSIIIAGADYKKDDAYRTSKDTIDMLCKSYSYVGLNSVVLNIPKVFGPGCRPNYNSFVTTLIHAAANGRLNEQVKFIKNMDEELELIHVNDLCAIIEKNIQTDICGYTKYIFTENNGLIKITFAELINALNGYRNHQHAHVFQEVVMWYKQNE